MKDTFYILARSEEPEDVFDAVTTYITCFDTIEEARAYGVDRNRLVIVKLTTTDGFVLSDDDIEIVERIE